MQRRQQQQASLPSGAGSSAQPSGSASAGHGNSSGSSAAVDREWLKQQLVRVMQWDPFAAEGVVAAVEGASTQDEVEDLVEVRGRETELQKPVNSW